MGVEPHIGKDRPTFIYHFPATQASLAQISPEDHRVAERFEVYYKGIELANGFHELTDAHEQRLRFEQDNRKRAARGLPQQPIDNNLLAALEAVCRTAPAWRWALTAWSCWRWALKASAK